MIRRKPASSDTVKVTFALPLNGGHRVSVVGDFNAWDPFAHPLRKRSNGTRSVTVELPTGASYRFRYLAEGDRFFDDDEADGYATNDFGGKDGVLLT